MSLTDRVAGITNKGSFYARKLPWTLGLKSRFQTQVGLLTVPKTAVSPAIFYHLLNGDYESPELALLDEHLSPDDCVLELGAGIGFLANRYGKRCTGRTHLAIEASPTMATLIRANTRQLGNVDVMNAVAAKAPAARPASFYIYSDFWASSTLPLHLTNPQRHLVETVQVPTVDLDALIAERRVSVLVCDIEGGEYELVRTFDLNVPKILMEVHWRELGLERALSVLRGFEERGYRLFGSPDVVMAVRSAE
jgi:FkbM family methyltransferase